MPVVTVVVFIVSHIGLSDRIFTLELVIAKEINSSVKSC
jgi:hypothetical protein